jgi:hypothetical protein
MFVVQRCAALCCAALCNREAVGWDSTLPLDSSSPQIPSPTPLPPGLPPRLPPHATAGLCSLTPGGCRAPACQRRWLCLQTREGILSARRRAKCGPSTGCTWQVSIACTHVCKGGTLLSTLASCSWGMHFVRSELHLESAPSPLCSACRHRQLRSCTPQAGDDCYLPGGHHRCQSQFRQVSVASAAFFCLAGWSASGRLAACWHKFCLATWLTDAWPGVLPSFSLPNLHR